jgi:hypothetical protein
VADISLLHNNTKTHTAMKTLSEIRANATYSVMSIEELNNLRKSGVAKNVFSKLRFDKNDNCYTLTAETILTAVKMYCDGFVKDIATRFSDTANRTEMSEKQAWVVSFAFIKIHNELGEEIF